MERTLYVTSANEKDYAEFPGAGTEFQAHDSYLGHQRTAKIASRETKLLERLFIKPNTVAVKIGRMFSYFAYTRCGLLHFLVYNNVVYTIRKSKLWVTLW